LFPLVGETKTRGHSLKIRGSRFRTEMRRNYFSQRVMKLWNSLPREAVEAALVSTFKTQLYRFLHGRGIKGYGENASGWS